jgi:hypothetical protein
MTLMKIRLELARDRDFPQGSPGHGYELVAPLDRTGHIDAGEWQRQRARCIVRRFWGGEDQEIGHLIHTRDRAWAFHYDIEGDAERDEPGYRFQGHVFKPGEYVSVREQDGRLRAFKVAAVLPA